MFTHQPDGYVCPFCRNIRDGESDHPLEIVYRDDDVFVKVNPKWRPDNPGAALVIPVEHHENLYDLPDRLALPLQRARPQHRARHEISVRLRRSVDTPAQRTGRQPGHLALPRACLPALRVR